MLDRTRGNKVGNDADQFGDLQLADHYSRLIILPHIWSERKASFFIVETSPSVSPPKCTLGTIRCPQGSFALPLYRGSQRRSSAQPGTLCPLGAFDPSAAKLPIDPGGSLTSWLVWNCWRCLVDHGNSNGE